MIPLVKDYSSAIEETTAFILAIIPMVYAETYKNQSGFNQKTVQLLIIALIMLGFLTQKYFDNFSYDATSLKRNSSLEILPRGHETILFSSIKKIQIVNNEKNRSKYSDKMVIETDEGNYGAEHIIPIGFYYRDSIKAMLNTILRSTPSVKLDLPTELFIQQGILPWEQESKTRGLLAQIPWKLILGLSIGLMYLLFNRE